MKSTKVFYDFSKYFGRPESNSTISKEKTPTPSPPPTRSRSPYDFSKVFDQPQSTMLNEKTPTPSPEPTRKISYDFSKEFENKENERLGLVA